MFDLKDGDLKIAKVLWNIAIPLFLAAPVAFLQELNFLLVFLIYLCPLRLIMH